MTVTAESPRALLDQLRANSNDNQVLFQATTSFTECPHIVWAGADTAAFLELHRRLGAGVLYWYSGDPDPEHGDEPGVVEVAFLRDGYFHVLARRADWFVEEEETDEEEEEDDPDDLEFASGDDEEKSAKDDAKLAEQLRSGAETLTDAFLAELDRQADAFSTDGRRLVYELRDWLSSEHSYPDREWAYPKLMKAIEALALEIGEKVASRERAALDGLVADCVAWGRTNGLKRLTQSDVDIFLATPHRALSREGRKALWQRANFELKARRG